MIIKGGNIMAKEIIESNKVPSSAIYSQGIKAGELLFTYGQIGVNVLTGTLSNATFEEEVKQSLENIKSILQEVNLCLEDVIKVTVFITDMNLFDSLNKVYLTFFPNKKPTRSAVEVSKLAKDARVEIEAIAFRK